MDTKQQQYFFNQQASTLSSIYMHNEHYTSTFVTSNMSERIVFSLLAFADDLIQWVLYTNDN